MPPPARPAAPRNYIIDSRYRGQTQQPQRELYAQNTYKPSAQFPEVKRVVPSSTYPPQQQVEEPYANIRHNYGEESEPPARPRQHPGYDYVKPYKNKQLQPQQGQYEPVELPTHDYDYPRQSSVSHDYDYPRNSNNVTEEPHYMDPVGSRNDGYRVPGPHRSASSYDDEHYPPYQLPSSPSSYTPAARNGGHDMHAKG